MEYVDDIGVDVTHSGGVHGVAGRRCEGFDVARASGGCEDVIGWCEGFTRSTVDDGGVCGVLSGVVEGASVVGCVGKCGRDGGSVSDSYDL